MALLYCRHDAADLLFDKKAGPKPITPEVINVTSSNANGTYSTGSPVLIQVVFNTTVVVTGTPRLLLNTGTPATTNINYTSGSGSNTLTFTYTVVALNSNPDLDYDSTAALTLNGGTILGTTGIVGILTLPIPGAAGSLGANKNLNINTTVPAPTVTDVNSTTTTDGTYFSGQVVNVEVTFSTAVNYTGTPQIILNTGSPATTAVNVTSGIGTNKLTFAYTIGDGNNSADLDYTSTTALILNGGTITNTTSPFPAAILTLVSPGAAGSFGANKNIVIDAVIPVITGITSSPATGSYKSGDSISIYVAYSKNMAVTTGGGTPSLALNSGGTATYSSVTTNTLTFTYTVGGSQTTNDLDVTGLSFNGGTIKDTLGNSATTTLSGTTLATSSSVIIDTIQPTITDITSTATDDVYTVNQTILVQVVFSETVYYTGTPQVTLNSTGTVVNISGGSASNTLEFSYTVAPGHSATKLEVVSLAGGTIRDAANNNATLTVFGVGVAGSLGVNKNIKIDTTAPTVTNVTSAAGGNQASSTISIQVLFSKAVVVAGGTPTLDLKNYAYVLFSCTAGNGGGTWSAAYNSGSGTKTLIFTISFGSPVLVGDCTNRLDYKATNSLATGGTIQDLSGINAILTLPAPGAAGSLGNNTNIQVN
jgi:hypothetical protein